VTSADSSKKISTKTMCASAAKKDISLTITANRTVKQLTIIGIATDITVVYRYCN
jgi:hypothetical protein